MFRVQLILTLQGTETSEMDVSAMKDSQGPEEDPVMVISQVWIVTKVFILVTDSEKVQLATPLHWPNFLNFTGYSETFAKKELGSRSLTRGHSLHSVTEEIFLAMNLSTWCERSISQDSPPAWTQEAYRPLRGKHTLCYPRWGGGGYLPWWGVTYPGGGYLPWWGGTYPGGGVPT